MKIKSIIFDTSVLIRLPKEEMRQALDKIVSYYLEPSKFINDYKRAFKKFQKGTIDEVGFFAEAFKKYELPLRSVKRIIEQHNSKRNSLVKEQQLN